jgi:hypothetical protein
VSDLTDLAEKIDAMTLDELMANATGGLPVAGGEYDTKRGWSRRMKVDIKSQKFVGTWKMLDDAGLIKMVKGHVQRDGHLYTATMYHCPTLAKKLNSSDKE